MELVGDAETVHRVRLALMVLWSSDDPFKGAVNAARTRGLPLEWEGGTAAPAGGEGASAALNRPPPSAAHGCEGLPESMWACLGRNLLVGGASGLAIGGPLGGLTKAAGAACFVADTQVLMGDRSSKAIQDIQVGDEVLAWNPATDQNEPRKVVETFIHEDVETWEVETSDGQVITTTAEHPFWVEGKGWTSVKELAAGDVLASADGSVDLVRVEVTGETARVFNLHVEGLHNYRVGDPGNNLRVHNECGPTGSWFPKRARPRDLESGLPKPDSDFPHTQLGQKSGSKGTYPQAREFGENGVVVKDVDFTDHGRPARHTSPYENPYIPNATGGTPKRGRPQPLNGGK